MLKEDAAEAIMPISQYKFWYDYLAQDNSEKVDKILQETDSDEKILLLNGKFDLEDTSWRENVTVEVCYCILSYTCRFKE